MENQPMYMDNDCPEVSRRSRPSRAVALVGLVVLVALPGCGDSGLKGPHGTVHGKITVDGAAVPSGTIVTYISEAGGTASGMADAEGAYRLTSMYGESVPVGNYKVVVMPASVESSLTPEQQMEESMQAMQSGNDNAPADNARIPTKYGNFATTPESREVKEGENEIDISLAK